MYKRFNQIKIWIVFNKREEGYITRNWNVFGREVSIIISANTKKIIFTVFLPYTYRSYLNPPLGRKCSSSRYQTMLIKLSFESGNVSVYRKWVFFPVHKCLWAFSWKLLITKSIVWLSVHFNRKYLEFKLLEKHWYNTCLYF